MLQRKRIVVSFFRTTNRSFELRKQVIDMEKKWFTKEVPKGNKTSALAAAWVVEFLNRHQLKPGDVVMMHHVENHVIQYEHFDNTYYLIYFAEKELE